LLATTFRSLGSSADFYLHAFRIAGELMIIVGLLFALSHRIIGLALTYYVQTKLDPDKIGQYQLSFKWISLRFGLDQNMLVLSGFEWRNPPEFTKSPYFIHIDEVSLTFEPWSVYGAVMHDTAIKVKEIRLYKARIHLERLTQNSIDKAAEAALKARTPLTSASLDASTEEQEESSSRETQREPLKPGVLNMWAAMGARDPDQAAPAIMMKVLSDVMAKMGLGGTLVEGAQTMWRNLKGAKRPDSTPTGGRRNTAHATEPIPQGNKRLSASKAGQDGKAADFSDSSSDHEAEMTMEETVAMLQAEYPDFVLPPRPDEDDDDDYAQASTVVQEETPQEIRARRRHALRGFGVPYKFEVDFILLHDFQIHAQDLLTLVRTKDTKDGVIKLSTLAMLRNDLTLPPDNELDGHRRGIYLDAVVLRLVSRLVSELLRKNFVAMALLLTSATTSAVSTASGMAGRGARDLLRQAAASTTEYALSAVANMFTSVGSDSNANNRLTDGGENATPSTGNILAAATAGTAKSALNRAVGNFLKRPIKQ
jgi:hypothetical protein